jgi:hypothetical protein
MRRLLPVTGAALGSLFTTQALAADTTQAMPDRQVRPGVALAAFGAAGDGGHGNGTAVGDTYQWSFGANPDVVVITDGALQGVVANDKNISETVSFQLINGSTREVVEATLTVTGADGVVSSDTVRIDIVAPGDDISNTPLEDLAIEVNIAIDDGLRAMYLNQDADGRTRFGVNAQGAAGSNDCGTTAFTLWAFSNRGHGPLSDTLYAPASRRALGYIFSDDQTFDPANQAFTGDPDRNGNNRVINLCRGNNEGYASPIAASAIMAAYSAAPGTVLDFGPYAGQTVFQVVEDAVEWTAFAQSDRNDWARGGWRYNANSSADTSVDSWHYLAIEGFETVFGGSVNDLVKAEAERRLVASQRVDGGFLYDTGNLSGDSSARTAGGLSGLLMVTEGGRLTPNIAAPRTANVRINEAIAALGTSWNNPGNTWLGNIPNYYAMWTSARALRLAGVDALVNGGIAFDWETGDEGDGEPNNAAPRRGYFPYLVGAQAADGRWPATVNGGNWTTNLNTAWAVLILTPTVFGPPPPDNMAPECVAQNVTVPVDDACGWQVTAEGVNGGSTDPDGDALALSIDPDAGVGLAVTDVTLTVTDPDGLADSCTATVTPVDGIAPTLECDVGGPYECVDGCAAAELTAQAADNCSVDLPVLNDGVACFGLGTTPVTFTTADASGNGATCTAQVTVVDTTAPTIVVGSAYNEIWPPNHKCQAFDLIEDCAVEVSDACSTDPADLDIRITSISSDEAFEVGAGGDGHHADDIEILSATTFELRAERQGGGNSRFYTIQFEVTDPAGNTAEAACAFVVPHDQSPKHARVNDGPAVTCERFDDCVCLDSPLAQGRAKGR